MIIDATLIRLLIVPSLMFVFDRANWWIPAWLDRVLPRLEPEPAGAPAPARDAPGGPAPGSGRVIAAGVLGPGRSGTLQPAREVVVGAVPAQLVGELRDGGVLVDDEQLDPGDLGQVAQRLEPQRRW